MTTVVQALAAVMEEVQSVGKKSRNNEQGYNFRGIDAVVNEVGPKLRKHGVIVAPMLQKASYRDVLTTKGKPSRESTVEVCYRFYGPEGDFIDAVVPGEAMDFGDKGVAKSMSVAYRIVLLQVLCIPTDEPDADSQSYERAADTGSPEAIDLFAAVMDAKTETELRKAWEDICEVHEAGRITAREKAQLSGHVKRRKSEVTKEAEGDGTSDGDGGGTEPVPAGEGTGPDGVSTAERGPGSDEVAGAARPGVQPIVHNGPGVGGPAQAPSGRRDAPAARGSGRG